MNCPICGKPMDEYLTKTTYDSNRTEFDHKRFRCLQDNVWSRLEIPKTHSTQQSLVAFPNSTHA